MIRVTPGIKPSTHSYIQTGQEDSKFGFGLDDVPRAVAACADAGLQLDGLHAHIGSQIFELDGFERLAEVLSGLGEWPLLNLGGGLGRRLHDETSIRRRSRSTPRPCCSRAPRGRDRALRAGPLAGRQRRA